MKKNFLSQFFGGKTLCLPFFTKFKARFLNVFLVKDRSLTVEVRTSTFDFKNKCSKVVKITRKYLINLILFLQ